MSEHSDRERAQAIRPPDEAPPRSRRRRPQRRGPKRARGGPVTEVAAGSPEARARHILEALRGLATQLAAARGLDPGEQLPLERLALPISVSLDGSDDDQDAPALVGAMREGVDEALKALGGYRAGQVYCFQCDRPGCAHALPRGADEVFIGYSPTGKPLTRGFAELCMSRGEARVAEVYGERPEVVAMVMGADELAGTLLPGFGGDGRLLRVLGQIVAGMLPAPYDPVPERGERVAVTVQVVETRGARGGHRLRMNLLGTTLATVADVADREGRGGQAEAFSRALATLRRGLRTRARDLQRGERHGQVRTLDGGVLPLLQDAQRDIERIFRGHRFRSQHAEERRRGGERPTGSAVSEARSAPDARLLFDTQRKTVVVVGKRGRAHVFSAQGLHITSLQLGPTELERKADQGRWKPLGAARIAAFRAALAAREVTAP